MSGFNRRHKALKGRTSLDDLDTLSIVNPADGDLLIYESTDGQWHNAKALTGDYSISGLLTLGSLSVTGAIALGDDLSVVGDAFVGGDLAVTDDFTADNAALNSLNVAGAAVLASTLSIAGTLSGAGFSFSGNGTIAGDLTVDDLTADVLTAGSLALTSGTFGTLHVTGATTLDSDLTAGANISAVGSIGGADLSASDDLFVGDVALIGTSLQVGVGFGGQNTFLDIDSLDWLNAGALVGRLSVTTAGVAALGVGATPETGWDVTLNGAFRAYFDNAATLATTSGSNDALGLIVRTALGGGTRILTVPTAGAGSVLCGSQTAAIGTPGSAGIDLQGTGADSFFGATRFGGTTPGNSSGIWLRRSRGASVGTHTIVVNGDEIGQVTFSAANGSTYTTAARMTGVVDGTPGAASDMPGALQFETTPDGSGTPVKRLRIVTASTMLLGALTNDPTSGGTQNALLTFASGAATPIQAGLLGYESATGLVLRNQVHGGSLTASIEDSGGNVEIGLVQTPDAGVGLRFANLEKLTTLTDGARLWGDANSAADTTTPGNALLKFVDNDASHIKAVIGFENSTGLVVRNQLHGGTTTLSVEDSSGNVENGIVITPDSSVELFFANDTKLATTTDGLYVTSTANRVFIDMVSTGNNATRIRMGNTEGGADVFLGSSLATPAGGLILQQRAAQSAGAVGASEDTWIGCARNGAVSLYYNGSDKFTTGDETAAGQITGANVKHVNGTYYPVGLAVRPFALFTGNHTIDATYACGLTQSADAGAVAYTTPAAADATIPIGFWFQLVNSGPAMTIVAGSGASVYGLSGAAVLGPGTRTLATGASVIIYYRGIDVWYVTGTGIT